MFMDVDPMSKGSEFLGREQRPEHVDRHADGGGDVDDVEDHAQTFLRRTA